MKPLDLKSYCDPPTLRSMWIHHFGVPLCFISRFRGAALCLCAGADCSSRHLINCPSLVHSLDYRFVFSLLPLKKFFFRLTIKLLVIVFNFFFPLLYFYPALKFSLTSLLSCLWIFRLYRPSCSFLHSHSSQVPLSSDL